MVTTLKMAVMGTGFWANFQIPAWYELNRRLSGEQPLAPGAAVEVVALYNRTRAKAEAMAEKCAAWSSAAGGTAAPPKVYDDAEQLLVREQPDFVDVITEVPAHAPLVHLAAKYRIPVICQKPMAPDFETACGMVRACSEVGVPFFVHENFRWQKPIRELKKIIDSGEIGSPFRARLQFVFHKPFVFDNQPMLKTLDKLALADVGSHLFDLARFYFGDPLSIYCQTRRVRPDITGEDVASAILRCAGPQGDVICSCDMSYSSRTEEEQFPQTLFYIEGSKGTVELAPGFWLRLTTDEGTFSRRIPYHRYPWADPDYAVAHSSIVDCNADLLGALCCGRDAETTGLDNLKTMRLVYRAYESAAGNEVVHLDYGDCFSL